MNTFLERLAWLMVILIPLGILVWGFSHPSDAKNKALREAENLLDIQGSHGNWNYSPYMLGMYNGMALIVSIMRGDKNPEYKDAPEKWLEDA